MEQLVINDAALIAVDFQEGVLRVPFVPNSSSDVLKQGADLVKSFREIGGTVVFTRVAWAADFADALSAQVDRQLPMPPGGLPADWADLAKDLNVQSIDIVITKRQWNAFHGTELDLQLRRRGIKTVVLAGVATNMGVESTARTAYELGYQVIFAQDAMSSVAPGMHEFAVQGIFPMLGLVRSTKDIISSLKR